MSEWLAYPMMYRTMDGPTDLLHNNVWAYPFAGDGAPLRTAFEAGRANPGNECSNR